MNQGSRVGRRISGRVVDAVRRNQGKVAMTTLVGASATLGLLPHAADAWTPPAQPNPTVRPVDLTAGAVAPGVDQERNVVTLFLSPGTTAPGVSPPMTAVIQTFEESRIIHERIDALYRDLLDRAPTDAEDVQAEHLRLEQKSVDEIVTTTDNQIRAGREYGLRVQLVGLFENTLGRSGTPDELRAETAKGLALIASGTSSDSQVLDELGQQLKTLPEWRVRMVGQLSQHIQGAASDPNTQGFQDVLALAESLAAQGKTPDEIQTAVQQAFETLAKPAVATPVEPAVPALAQEANHAFTFEALWPYGEKYGQQYGVDPKVVMAIVAQESSFINYQVHRDGTGHGLIGLDDNGMLPAFEAWTNQQFGRGADALAIPPELQIEFLAKTLAEYAQANGGDSLTAARAWHRGAGSAMFDSYGDAYANLIQAHIAQYFG